MNGIKRVLLVGTSFSASPIFFALKKYGFHVSVCGNAKDDPCHQYADKSYYIDYSKPLELLALIESENFDFLVPTCNDYSYLSAASVAEKYNFLGYDKLSVTNIIHKKNEFREFTQNNNIPVPLFKTVNSFELHGIGDMKFPLLIKPVDSFSGRGMVKVEKERDLIDGLSYAKKESRSGQVILEEFVEGSLHSHSAFIENKKISLDFFVDEFCTVYPYQVNSSNHPSRLKDSMRMRVRSAIIDLINLLELNDGLLHTQFIVNGDKFWILECMRRAPGDLFGTMIERSVDIDYADLFIRPFLGMKYPTNLISSRLNFIGRHTISRQQSKILFSIKYSLEESEVQVVPLKMSGEILEAAPFDKAAIALIRFKSLSRMLKLTPNLEDLFEIDELGGEIGQSQT